MQPPGSPETSLTIAELRRQVTELKEAKGFDITIKQRLAYLLTEVGEVAREVLKLSRDGNGDVGEMHATERTAVREDLGMEIYDAVWNLLDLAELARIEDLEGSFRKKAGLDRGREWSGASKGEKT